MKFYSIFISISEIICVFLYPVSKGMIRKQVEATHAMGEEKMWQET